ncbi:GNAT family N-acetyltransferase [uncultured Celeribacter sp.]|uniref:GNAT family N-acetyltransferase n=1 Tax=uncultured Celeribacter sp. TaxID=1303376 RepID=UPI002AA8C41E|nr:GNAT family N-acetyltransferase [uncultured Celeribacter sp.]
MADLHFARLPEVSAADILNHMRDPRVAEHMPLLTMPWTGETVGAFVAAKEACWTRDGLGHWAFLADGAYVGWGGFQKEGEEWDFGLVLRPDSFGLGVKIAKKVLEFVHNDARIPTPPSSCHRPAATSALCGAWGRSRWGRRFMRAIGFSSSGWKQADGAKYQARCAPSAKDFT